MFANILTLALCALALRAAERPTARMGGASSPKVGTAATPSELSPDMIYVIRNSAGTFLAADGRDSPVTVVPNALTAYAAWYFNAEGTDTYDIYHYVLNSPAIVGPKISLIIDGEDNVWTWDPSRNMHRQESNEFITIWN
ncbi:hypothetical protein B0H14DRAFT_2564309 [Mycena olivaceomarginata]|nr:hypothetical protein B0H14DRAFT_2564309 [Mycena olivaceomarginata]